MKLIDKRELMELLDDMFSRYDGTPSVMEGFKYGLDAVISEVSVMPTIDAVEVVRCKDCRYFKKYGFKLEYTECLHFDCDVSEDGYCVYGAKMDANKYEEPEINPCRGCEDYDGKGGCLSNGGCADANEVNDEL